MASREKKNGGDFVLESRHLVGLFMLLVVIFGVVFTLGYLLGRSQYDTRLRAAVDQTVDADGKPITAIGKIGESIDKIVESVGKTAGPVGKTAESGGKTRKSVGKTAETAGKTDEAVGKNAGTVAKTVESDPSPSEPAAKLKGKSGSDNAAPKPNRSDWDFYHSAEPKTAEDHLQPPVKTVATKQPPAAPQTAAAQPEHSAHAKPANSSSSVGGPLVPKGAIMLQVAAVRSEGDALALAQALQQKKFPAFVITPSASSASDKFYRVQVGPYADNQSATIARHDLETNGFKTIVKR